MVESRSQTPLSPALSRILFRVIYIGVVPFFFLIAGGLYSITELRKTGAEETVYLEHQERRQASEQASATTKTRVASRHGSS